MSIKEICDIVEAKIICGENFLNRQINYGFASDLMSDVLTIDAENRKYY